MLAKFIGLSLLLVLLSTMTMSGQDAIQKDTIDPGKSFTAAYPILFYFPETRLGFGAAGIRTFFLTPVDSKYRRPSSISVGLAYTLERQILLFNEFKLYFNESKSRVFGELGYYKFFYSYYGLGNNSRLEDEELFHVKYPRVKLTYLHEVRENLFVGLRYHFDDYKITKIDSAGLLETNEVQGYQGGVISNVGLVSQFDSRDNVFCPHKGVFIKARFMLSNTAFGGDYNYIRWSIDSRYFKRIGNSVLAIQNYFGGSTVEIPFQEMFLVGGASRGRGLTTGRYRGRYYHVLQSEIRFPIYRRLSGVGFIGTYRVDMDKLKTVVSDPKLTYGFGFRLLLNKKDRLNIRTDFGFGEEGSKFYFTISEAF